MKRKAYHETACIVQGKPSFLPLVLLSLMEGSNLNLHRRLTGVQAPRPRMQSPAIPHSKPMAKKMDDVSIICINFVRYVETVL